MTRGTKSYKERHWKRKHKGEKGNFQSYIVPKNHVKAQELLRQNEEKNKESEARSGSSKGNNEEDNVQCLDDETDSEVDEIPPIAQISPLDTSLADEVMERSQELASVLEANNLVLTSSASTVTNASQGDSVLSTAAPSTTEPARAASRSTTTSENRGAAATVQSTVTGFFQTSGKQPEGADNAIERIEDGINQILIRMDAMDIREKGAQMHVDSSKEIVGAADVKAAKNLVDLSSCQQVRVETLEDGCRVTCIPCYEYIRANPLMKM